MKSIWILGDFGAITIISAALIGWLPAAAAFVAIFWYTIQMYESRTIQNYLRVRQLRKLVKLRAEATALALYIRDKNTDLRGLDLANQVHEAATHAVTESTHTQAVAERLKSTPPE